MKILTAWLRTYLPTLPVSDAQLAEDLTLRGIAVEGTFPIEGAPGGTLFDMDITTNRVDAMNHYGIAREAATIYNLPLAPLLEAPLAPSPGDVFPVRIDAPDLCGRFTAQVIRNVTIAPSTGVLADYFAALGQKPVSNAVDITNFVLLGMGHPTHAFDLDKIDGGIVVRRAHPGEQLRLLDGTTRTLVADDLVVADHTKALALAGVMGGWDSMITPETKNILVEAAWFSPAAVRASSRRHLLHTDASHRFERGADFAAAPLANALVSQHILAACGGTLTGSLVDLTIPALAAQTIGRPPVSLALAEVHRILGTTVDPQGITAELIARFLTALGCTLAETGAGNWSVTLPSWRLDLTREIDLIEEIARVYGYNGFANTLPTPAVTVAHPTARPESAVHQRLLALGYSEALFSTFASAQDSTLFAPETPTIPLENPLSEEAALLRPSLLPGMAAMLAHNLTRDVLSVRLFETGHTFTGTTDVVTESLALSLGLTGPVPASPLHAPADAPIFELKAVLESLVSLFDTPTPVFTLADAPSFEPGRAATLTLAGSVLARFGQLSTAETHRRKLRQPVFLAHLDLQALTALPLRQPLARELSRFQAVDRDFSFTFPDSTPWSTLESALRALNLPDLVLLTPAEIFRDPKRNPGHESILIRTVFQSLDRTLTDSDLTAASSAIISTLQSLGGTLRA